MSDATPEHEREARRQQRDFDRIQNAAAAVVFYTGSAAVGAFSVYVAVAAAVGFAARDRSIVMGFIANDPPAQDYRTATRIRRDVHISFGRVVDVPIAYAADEVIESLTTGSAALRAMLRAAERATGARLDGASRFAEARHQEALDFGLRAASENRRYASAIPALVESMSRLDGPIQPDPTPRAGDSNPRYFSPLPPEDRDDSVEVLPRAALSSEALSILYSAGVPASFVRTQLGIKPTTRPFEALTHDLRLSSRNARRYSNYLSGAITRELDA